MRHRRFGAARFGAAFLGMTLFGILVFGWAAASGCERSAAPAPGKPDKPGKNTHGADDEVQIRTIPVAGTVHMLMGKGGNIGVSAGADGILIIDDQFAPLAGKIRAALATLGEGSPHYVLNTHHHGDHTGGNREFGREARIIAHDNVRKRLVGEEYPKVALPVITFNESLTVHFNGEAIRAVHFARGHTDGDSIIFFTGSNVVHMGDEFFNGRYPYVDLNSGGDPLHLAENIKTVLAMVKLDTKIIPGHGPLAVVADLRAYHEMLTETTAAVRAEVAAGKTLAEIQARGLPAKWDGWGQGFVTTERWIETLHKALTAGPGGEPAQ